MIGLFVGNDCVIVDNFIVCWNGLFGMLIMMVYGIIFLDLLVIDNNIEYFNGLFVVGGVKVMCMCGIVMSNVDMSCNIGSGMWFDEFCYDVKIFDVILNDNMEIGIYVELFLKVMIVCSQVFDNWEGICIFDMENVLILNNDFGNNFWYDLNLMQDEWCQVMYKVGCDFWVFGVDFIVMWIMWNIMICNNVFGVGGLWVIFVYDMVIGCVVDMWNVMIDGNLFSSVVGGLLMVIWGGFGDVYEMFCILVQLVVVKNLGWCNVQIVMVELFVVMVDDIVVNVVIVWLLFVMFVVLFGFVDGIVLFGSGC